MQVRIGSADEPDAVWLIKEMSTRWTRKDLLGLRELSADEINFILETADAFKEVGHARDQEGAGAARQDAGKFLR